MSNVTDWYVGGFRLRSTHLTGVTQLKLWNRFDG